MMDFDFSQFKKLSIGGVELSKLCVGRYANLAFNSIDTDDSIYNDCGYIEGYRLNSSGALSAQSNTVTTGFIPCNANSVIRTAGAPWFASTRWDEYFYLSYYDINFNYLGGINSNYDAGAFSFHSFGIVDKDQCNIRIETEDIAIFNVGFLADADTSAVAYFRVNGKGNGSSLIVTVDEEISNVCVFEKSVNYVNQVPISTDTDGSIFNGVGYKENVRLSSSGGISGSAQNGSVTTGFIPFPYGDETIIRLKGVEWWMATANYSGHYYLNLYDSNKKFLAYLNSQEAPDAAHIVTITRDESGVETFVWNTEYGTTNAYLQAVRNDAKYIRINARGKGADMIVTINEEII